MLNFKIENKENKLLVGLGYYENGEYHLYSDNSTVKSAYKLAKKSNLFVEKMGLINFINVDNQMVYFAGINKIRVKKRGQTSENQEVRITFSKLFNKINHYESVGFDLSSLESLSKEINTIPELFLSSVIEGFGLASYEFNHFKTVKNDMKLTEVSLLSLDKKYQESLNSTLIKIEGNFFARDLASYPANVANSQYILDYVQDAGKKYGFETSYLGQAQLEELKMGGILSVNQGSENPPYLVTAHYKPSNAKKKVLLVGKGVTFDTGGYSLKPSGSMLGMKYDMHGSATVIGAMTAIARMKLDVEVVMLVGLVENMVNGKSFRPGDIITQYNGMTVEVGNTDAEGRLVLADLLSYGIEQHNPDLVIDVATLTGACNVAIGCHAVGLMTNDTSYGDQLLNTGRIVGEACWELPMFDVYGEEMKGTISDLSNISSNPGHAGTITAGKFLENFVGKTSWIHLDIASTASLKTDMDYRKKGITGVGVRLISSAIETMSF